MPKVKTRTINVTVERDPEDLAARKALCRAYKEARHRVGLTSRELAYLLGVGVATAQNWGSQGTFCVPPPVYALRFLWLLERHSDIKDRLSVCPINYYERADAAKIRVPRRDIRKIQNRRSAKPC